LLLSATNPYAQRYAIKEQFWHEGYQVLKYSSGEEYVAHYDGDTAMGRAVSAIVYLNDDYEGGHIEFPNFNIKIKPQPGMLLLFPSNYAYTHVARPVTTGTKYAIVTWIKDRQI
jgi:predicted 2-oxoglutarate/Fe(II)-dependent dioxygenase YbiX